MRDKQAAERRDVSKHTGRGAAGQLVRRRELLRRGVSLGISVLCVGSAWGAGKDGVGGKDELCTAYDLDGNLIIDTLCGSLDRQSKIVEDLSCAKPLHQGEWTGPLSQDYDCSLAIEDQSCGKAAGVGSSGPTSYWSDSGCALGGGQDKDCGLESWTGELYRDNDGHGNT